MDTENIAPSYLSARVQKPLRHKDVKPLQQKGQGGLGSGTGTGKGKPRRRALGDITNRRTPREMPAAPLKKATPRDTNGVIEMPETIPQAGPTVARYEPLLDFSEVAEIYHEEDGSGVEGMEIAALAPPPRVEWDEVAGWDNFDVQVDHGFCLRDALIPDEVGALELAGE